MCNPFGFPFPSFCWSDCCCIEATRPTTTLLDTQRNSPKAASQRPRRKVRRPKRGRRKGWEVAKSMWRDGTRSCLIPDLPENRIEISNAVKKSLVFHSFNAYFPWWICLTWGVSLSILDEPIWWRHMWDKFGAAWPIEMEFFVHPGGPHGPPRYGMIPNSFPILGGWLKRPTSSVSFFMLGESFLCADPVVPVRNQFPRMLRSNLWRDLLLSFGGLLVARPEPGVSLSMGDLAMIKTPGMGINGHVTSWKPYILLKSCVFQWPESQPQWFQVILTTPEVERTGQLPLVLCWRRRLLLHS